MDSQELLKKYLFDRHSCFNAALRDTRKATRRYQKNGQKNPTMNHGNWLGAIGYMSLLDQIGGCLKPLGSETKYTNEIKKALDYFDSGLNDDEINALYALRCSFAHNYSLVNIPKDSRGKNKSKEKLTHCFIVGVDNIHKIVELPQEKWNGDFSNVSPKTMTYINLEKFGDLVEKIRSKIIEKYKRNKIELSVSVEEFQSKYFFEARGALNET